MCREPTGGGWLVDDGGRDMMDEVTERWKCGEAGEGGRAKAGLLGNKTRKKRTKQRRRGGKRKQASERASETMMVMEVKNQQGRAPPIKTAGRR